MRFTLLSADKKTPDVKPRRKMLFRYGQQAVTAVLLIILK